MIDEAKCAALRDRYASFVPLNQTRPEVKIPLDVFTEIITTLDVLLDIRAAAEPLIYRPRNEYSPTSKKARLKTALDKFTLRSLPGDPPPALVNNTLQPNLPLDPPPEPTVP